MVRAIRDRFFSKPNAPVMVLLAGEPHEAALMNAPDAVAGCLKLVPEGHKYTNEVPARIALAIPFAFPGAS